MHSYISKNFDAKVASSRFDVMAIRSGKRGGFGVACMRFVESLRHLAMMLRHRFTLCHISGSAQWAQSFGENPESGSPSRSLQNDQLGYQTGQYANDWQAVVHTTPAGCTKQKCAIQTLKRLKPASVVASLVTT